MKLEFSGNIASVTAEASTCRAGNPSKHLRHSYAELAYRTFGTPQPKLLVPARFIACIQIARFDPQLQRVLRCTLSDISGWD